MRDLKKLTPEEQRKIQEEKDKEVEAMIDTWDIVRCRYCGKQISMMKAKVISNGFICQEGH